eukprot:scaffold107958_cov22-Tisochrysis_lutea.AAC.1
MSLWCLVSTDMKLWPLAAPRIPAVCLPDTLMEGVYACVLAPTRTPSPGKTACMSNCFAQIPSLPAHSLPHCALPPQRALHPSYDDGICATTGFARRPSGQALHTS